MPDVYYHGTSTKAAKAILKEGFQSNWGLMGHGAYISKSWQTAMWYGNALLEVTLLPNIRILDVSIEPDSRVIRSFRREFGKRIIDGTPPHKVIPKGKKLTKIELLNIVRFLYRQSHGSTKLERSPRWYSKRMEKMEQALTKGYRSLLIQYGYHGYGDPVDEIGYVIFAPDRIVPNRIVVDTEFNTREMCNDIESGKYPTLESFVKAFSKRG